MWMWKGRVKFSALVKNRVPYYYYCIVLYIHIYSKVSAAVAVAAAGGPIPKVSYKLR